MEYTVGPVTVNTATGAITAPQDYLASEAWARTRAAIKAGEWAAFNAAISMGTMEPTGQIMAALIHADYASWKSTREFAASIGA